MKLTKLTRSPLSSSPISSPTSSPTAPGAPPVVPATDARRVPEEVVRLADGPAVLVAVDRDAEVARLLQPRPPLPVPLRTYAAPFPGWLAYQVLGHRIIRS
jgi:hypothetical protein